MAEMKNKWWQESDPSKQIWEDMTSLYEQHANRLKQNLTNLKLYGNKDLSGFGGYASEQSGFGEKRLTLNVIQSAIDAATAKISSSDTRSLFLTEGGNWKSQIQGKDLTRFIDGQYKRNNTYKECRNSFRDACIFDIGVIKHSINNDDEKHPRIVNERVPAVEVFVDMIDGKYGRPTRLHQVKEVGREVLFDHPKYKKFRDKIRSAQLINHEFSDYSNTAYSALSDPISLIESYHLPTTPTSGDGKIVISLSGCTLYQDEWKEPSFPFSFFRWLEKSFGFYGQGLADQLRSIQVSINKILIKVEQHMDKASSFVLAERGAKIVKSHLTNTPWTLMEYTGTAPIFATVAAISPEYFTQLDRMYAKAFEIAGISQLFAQNKLPGGLESGRAISAYKDNESERFQDVGKSWSEFQVDISEKQIILAKRLDRMTPGGYSVLAENKDRTLSRIKWKDVDLDRDAYIIQAYPTSYLPKNPAYRIDAVAQLSEVFPPLRPYLPGLLEYPDLEAVLKRLTAPTDYIEMITDRMLYDDAKTQEDLDDLYEPPDAFVDFQQALEITRGKLLRARIDNAPEERMQLLVQYMTDIQDLIQQQMEEAQRKQMEMQMEAQAAQMAAQGPPPPPPGGVPGPMSEADMGADGPMPEGMPMPPMPPEVM